MLNYMTVLLILPVLILIMIGRSYVIQAVVSIPRFPGEELLIHGHKLMFSRLFDDNIFTDPNPSSVISILILLILRRRSHKTFSSDNIEFRIWEISHLRY